MVTGMLGRFGKKGMPSKFKEKNITLNTHFLNHMKAKASLSCFEKKLSSKFKAI